MIYRVHLNSHIARFNRTTSALAELAFLDKLLILALSLLRLFTDHTARSMGVNFNFLVPKLVVVCRLVSHFSILQPPF
jgi:hypothetical protein